MGKGCIWPEPDAEICTLTLSGLAALWPAWDIMALAAFTSYLMSNLGLPHQG